MKSLKIIIPYIYGVTELSFYFLFVYEIYVVLFFKVFMILINNK